MTIIIIHVLINQLCITFHFYIIIKIIKHLINILLSNYYVIKKIKVTDKKRQKIKKRRLKFKVLDNEMINFKKYPK